jgi:hypothetical protein
MDATTSVPSVNRRAESAMLTTRRHAGVIHLLPSRRLKFSKAGQFCTNPLQLCDPATARAMRNAAFCKHLRRVARGPKSRAVARDLISCAFSHSGRACPLPAGKGVSDTGQRQASARAIVVRGRFGPPEPPDPREDDPRRPNEPPDTPETPPDEPPPTPVEEPPPPGKGPHVAGLDPG